MSGKKRRASRVTSRAPKKKWSLLAYIAGDNNLSSAGLKDIQEMCDEGSSPRVHVGVEIDTHGEFTGSVRYEISEKDWSGAAHRIVIDRLAEQDSGDPKSLTAFLKWGHERYPAENSLVVIWNHGSGFRSVRRDVGYDDFGSSLDMPEIEIALRNAGIGPNNPITVLGFDACLMNMLEIAHHLKEQVKILVGSQQTEPNDGWPYDQVLTEVKAAQSPRVLAAKIVDVYIRSYRNAGQTNVTQSAVDVDATQDAVKALGALGDALRAALPACGEAIRDARMTAQVFKMADYVDLIHLAETLRDRVPCNRVAQAAGQLISATKGCIIHNGRFGDAVKNANGLSVWFPYDAATYVQYRGKYLDLKCAQQEPGWVKFLDVYHQAVRTVLPAPTRQAGFTGCMDLVSAARIVQECCPGGSQNTPLKKACGQTQAQRAGFRKCVFDRVRQTCCIRLEDIPNGADTTLGEVVLAIVDKATFPPC